MKPDRNYLEVESTLTGEDVMMGIDLASMPHLMNVLTDLYEDRELACLREYSTNAWDANREAGNTNPIRVSLPSALRPLLVIEDDGPGLNAEDIRRIYSQYGASTKRDSDDAVGMLGLGCKSALTYADQFTLVSVKDGQRVTISISRDDAGSGVMKILSQEPTTDPTGTAVQIPVKRDNLFESKARNFFRFWEEGSVVLDGKAPRPLDGLKISDALTVLDGEPNDWIVMGNVPYPTQLGIYTGGYSSKHVVARVPIGAVNFTPSRESLMDTDKTEETLARVKRDFARYAKTAVQDAVEAAATKPEALEAFVAANAALPSAYRVERDTLSYQGEPLPDFPDVQYGNYISSSSQKHGLTWGEPDCALAVQAIWVTEYQNENWSGSQRVKLQDFLAHHNMDDSGGRRSIVILHTALPDEAKPWVPPGNVIPWERVKKWQPPRDPNAPVTAKRVTGSYNGYTPTGTYVSENVKATDLPQDDRVFWVQTTKYAGGGYHKRLKGMGLDDFWLILLPSTRVNKFKRDFPQARNLMEYVKARTKKDAAKLTRDQAIALRYQQHRAVARFIDLPPEQVDDPELSQVIRWSVATQQADSDLRVRMEKYGVDYPDGSTTGLFGECIDRYPLLDAVTYRAATDDLILYLNAAYAAGRK